MRKLKFHEQKLLKQVNFLEWRETHTAREQFLISRYKIRDREDIYKYKQIVTKIKQLCDQIALLKKDDGTRIFLTREIISKLFNMGLIGSRSLVDCAKIKISNFCERRITTIMVKKKMVSNLTDAVRFVEHGHVMVGSHVVVDPSTIISQGMEDMIEWRDKSKILTKIREFHGEEDDFY
ncbi:U3 small nucleolar ribonucleoprotein IMP3 [Dictyocoela muelleri]|nr:U3 small nucleolar ribonucleoprotein IMP3 [Dictyocoela muelleri]